MVRAAKLNGQRKQAGLPLLRFNIRKLSEEDLRDLRAGYEALYEISNSAPADGRGYWGTARGHGYDQNLCHNDDRIFLTWHRAYVYVLEKALNAAFQAKTGDPTLVLTQPYWDWTVTDPTTDADNGIPKALDDATYTDADGNTKPNPLARARSMYRVQDLNLTGDEQYTKRYPTFFKAEIPNLAEDVAGYMEEPDYMTFSDSFNGGAHGLVHVRVGGSGADSPLPRRSGDMSSVTSAAYDPIFWFHHGNVDKVWFDWQARYGNSSVPPDVMTKTVYGGFTGAQVMNAETDLKYIYANDVAGASDVDLGEDDVTAEETGGATYDLGDVSGDVARGRLEFHQLKPPEGSYEVRVFFNKGDANADTPLTDDAYAGRLLLFGHGRCFGAPGHCNPYRETRDDYDLRAKHPLRFHKTRYKINVSKGLRRAVDGLAPHETRNIKATLVVLDATATQVPVAELSFTNLSLTTR